MKINQKQMSDEIPTTYWVKIQGTNYRQPGYSEDLTYRTARYIHTLDYQVANIFTEIIPYIIAPTQQFIVHHEAHPEIIRKTEADLIKWGERHCFITILINPRDNEFVNSPLLYKERFWNPNVFNGIVDQGDYITQKQCVKILNHLSMLYPFIDEYRINQMISGRKPIVQYQ